MVSGMVQKSGYRLGGIAAMKNEKEKELERVLHKIIPDAAAVIYKREYGLDLFETCMKNAKIEGLV